jgi:hypothetical protein
MRCQHAVNHADGGHFVNTHGMPTCTIDVTPMACLLSQHWDCFFPLWDLVGPHVDLSKCPRRAVKEHAVNKLSWCQHAVTAVMLSTGCHLLSPAVSHLLSTCCQCAVTCCHLLSLCCQRAVMATSTVRGALMHTFICLLPACPRSRGHTPLPAQRRSSARRALHGHLAGTLVSGTSQVCTAAATCKGTLTATPDRHTRAPSVHCS